MKAMRGVTLIVLGVTILLLAGCGSSRAPRGMLPLGSDLISPAAVVSLGGFDFAANSYRIQHPYFVGNEFTPPLNFIGFGPGQVGRSAVHLCEDGGQVQGVHCLLYTMVERDENADIDEIVKVWVAQDTRGNVQILKLQDGEMSSPQLMEREDWYSAPNDGYLAQVYEHTGQGISGVRRRTLQGPQSVTFGANSANIVHPFFAANSATAEKRLRGYGTDNGRWERYRFSDGGQVNGIAAVKMTVTEGDAGSGPDSTEHMWFAQDTEGNVHFLKRSDEGEAFLIGVGAGRAPAWFLPADPTAEPWASGRPWFTFGGMIKMRVLAINASKHGRNDLLKCQFITDDNGDLRFDGRFSGVDDRDDLYFAPDDSVWFEVYNDGGEVNGFARVQ